MTFIRLVLSGFRYYFRRNLLIMAGIALSTAILTGALIIGDSMHFSLKHIVSARLGNTGSVITARDRYFTTSLADSIYRKTKLNTAPVFITGGSAIADGGKKRVNRVQFIGTDERFSGISGTEMYSKLSDNEIIINENLARHLEVKTGDVLLFRLAKASLVPLNTPFVSDAETTVSFRATVKDVTGSGQTGNLNLQNTQSIPYNVFIPLNRLNRLMEFNSRANHLLIEGDIREDSLKKVLDASLQPEDIGLKYRILPGENESEITSDRIFLDPVAAEPFNGVNGRKGILTYFVNSIRSGEKIVPYSFISSWEGLPLAEGEIILNDWTAGDLKVKPGDSVTISYYEIGPLRQLVEKNIRLKIHNVVPMNGEFGDRELMPQIPGLSDAGHCREWEAGVPIELEQIRQKDEDYWNLYKGTPKAFISEGLAQKIWSNRYGNRTAFRFPASGLSEEKFRFLFSNSCRADNYGISVRSVREEGLQAATQGTDFGQLFLGLSFFLLMSALLLTSLLFRFQLENRQSQIGTLIQLGFTKKQVSRIFLSEAIILSLPGILVGLSVAIVYVKVVFHFLNSIWWDIVRTDVILLNIRMITLCIGSLISLAVILVSVLFPIWNFVRKPVVNLQKGSLSGKRNIHFRTSVVGGIVLVVLGMTVVIWQILSGESQNPGYFFISGILWLSGFLWLFRQWLTGSGSADTVIPDYFRLMKLSVSRNPGRSMAIVIIFSLGTFLVIAVGANRQGVIPSGSDRTSGTGGFGYFADAVVPVLYDMNEPGRRLREGMDTSWHVVQMSRMSGDDASCLNLNRVSNPSVLGVESSELSGRFGFQTLASGTDTENPWLYLKHSLPGGVVPAIADQTVIQWGLGMKTGDTLLYLAETGDTLRLKLIAGMLPSVFQGYVLIDQSHFLKYYPSHSGSSVFLVDSHDEKVKDELADVFRDQGMDIIPAGEKLAMFQSVTNTYLSIFMALGFLALAVGTLGVLVVVARTLLERRRELAIFQATGFSRNQLVLMVISEYSGLLFIALGIGLLTAFISLFPAVLAGTLSVSLSFSAILLLGILIHGVTWIGFISFRQINYRNLISALTSE